jgi:flagellar motor protein MotB
MGPYDDIDLQIEQDFGSGSTTKTNKSGNMSGKMDTALAVTGGVMMAGQITMGFVQQAQANKLANEAEERRIQNEALLSELENSRQDIVNPYENISVATQAAEMQVQETDKALANTLDTLAATGMGAGGATALAQAAMKSKQGVSANIEQQLVQNEKLKAQGEQFAFQVRENREQQKLDRTAGLIDRDIAREDQYRGDAMAAVAQGFAGAAGTLTGVAGAMGN